MTLVRLVKKGDFGTGNNVWEAISSADIAPASFFPDPGDVLLREDLGKSYLSVGGGGLALTGAFTPPPASALLTHTALGSTGGTDVTTGAIDTTGASLIVVAIGSHTTVPSFTDSASNTWTLLAPGLSQNNNRLALFYCLNPTISATHTFTTTLGGSTATPSIAVASFSNVGGLGGITNDSIVAASGATLTLPTATPSRNNTLVVSALSFDAAATTIAIDSGFTITDQVNFSTGNHTGVALAFLLQGAQAALTPQWSGMSATLNKDAQMAAFARAQ